MSAPLLYMHILLAGVWFGLMLADTLYLLRVIEHPLKKNSGVSVLRWLAGLLTILVGVELARRAGFPAWTHASALLVLIMIIMDTLILRRSYKLFNPEAITSFKGFTKNLSPLWVLLYLSTLFLMITQPF